MPKNLQDIPGSAAAYNSVPTEEVYWDVVLTDVQATNTAVVTIQLTIEYFTQLYTLSDVADS